MSFAVNLSKELQAVKTAEETKLLSKEVMSSEEGEEGEECEEGEEGVVKPKKVIKKPMPVSSQRISELNSHNNGMVISSSGTSEDFY